MRRGWCLLLAAVLLFAAAGCVPNQEKDGKVEILRDTEFENGFGAMGVTSEYGYIVKRVLETEEGKENYDWLIAQWATRHSFETEMTRTEGEDAAGTPYVKFSNEAKEVIAYPGAGKLQLNAYASREYEAPRTADQAWVHLLAEQVFEGEQRVPFASMERLEMSLTFSVDRCENRMSAAEYDPSVHAAQISWYITVENSASAEVTPGRIICGLAFPCSTTARTAWTADKCWISERES